jgi:hypothetical protein
MQEDLENEPVLTVRQLTPPQFVPRIPDDLLENLPKRDQYVLKTLSVVAQQQEWQMEVLLDNNRSMVSMERRQLRFERWKNMLSSRWGLVAAVVAVSGPYIFPILPKLFQKLFGP